MKRTLQVHLGDESRRVGTLHYDQNGAREHGAFAYDEAWLAAKERFALDPTLPLVAGAQFHRKMTRTEDVGVRRNWTGSDRRGLDVGQGLFSDSGQAGEGDSCGS